MLSAATRRAGSTALSTAARRRRVFHHHHPREATGGTSELWRSLSSNVDLQTIWSSKSTRDEDESVDATRTTPIPGFPVVGARRWLLLREEDTIRSFLWLSPDGYGRHLIDSGNHRYTLGAAEDWMTAPWNPQNATHCARSSSLLRTSIMQTTSSEALRGLFLRSILPPSSTSQLLSSSASLLRRRNRFHLHQHHPQRQLAFFSTSQSVSSSGGGGGGDDEDSSAARRTRPTPSRTLGRSKIPTPDSAPPVAVLPAPKSILRKGLDFLASGAQTLVVFVFRLPGNIYYYIVHPAERRAEIAKIQKHAWEEFNHYWVGTKLLIADVRTARDLLFKTLHGSTLTRRERRQLLRTVVDMARLVPFSLFIIIPFMEFALPFALRIFPNLLPSTFQDSLKAEENMKRDLKGRIAMAQFFQETLEQLAKEQKRKAGKKKEELQEAGVDLGNDGCDTIDNQEDSAASMLEFLEKARNGQMIPPDIIIRYANYFEDDLTLDNMPRMQLINMCRYMSIPPYGSDAILRFQLRHRIRSLKEDDQKILWEGIDSLTKMELREACQERGMRSTGLSKDAYKNALQQWLDLSVNKHVPISLLIMSRTFLLKEDAFKSSTDDESANLTGLADAMSGLDKEVLNEVILEVATSEEKSSDPEIRKLQLEVVSKQNELIRAEQAARDAAAAKKKETVEKDTTVLSVGEEVKDITLEVDTVKAAEITTPETSVEQEVASQLGAASEDDSAVPATEEEKNLSTEEIEALRQLVTDDPVSSERAELERIKAAMSKNEEKEEEEVSSSDDPPAPLRETTSQIEEFASPTVVATNTEDTGVADEEEELDPIVARLKKRVESMVDKIELRLSDVQVKIGDKLHFLDKDRDGILSREEVAEVLQVVFKRKISFEEAMDIANEMDGNHDGIITVDELIRWIDETKLVKFVEAGQDAAMDRIIETQNTAEQQTDTTESSGSAKV